MDTLRVIALTNIVDSVMILMTDYCHNAVSSSERQLISNLNITRILIRKIFQMPHIYHDCCNQCFNTEYYTRVLSYYTNIRRLKLIDLCFQSVNIMSLMSSDPKTQAQYMV